jgi:hypothetical protein
MAPHTLSEQSEAHDIRKMQHQVMRVAQHRDESITQRVGLERRVSALARGFWPEDCIEWAANRNLAEDFLELETVEAMRARLVRINAEWRTLSRQSTASKHARMAELSLRRQALTAAIFEAELGSTSSPCPQAQVKA